MIYFLLGNTDGKSQNNFLDKIYTNHYDIVEMIYS